GVFKILAAIICSPVVFLGSKFKQLLRRKGQTNTDVNDRTRNNAGHIPRLARVIFFFVEKRSREHLVGDLEEEYWALIVQIRTPFQAWCWWCGEALCVAIAYCWKRIRRIVGLAAVVRMRRR